MIKNVLSDIGGIGIYGVISILLFFAVFTGMLFWAFSMKKSFAQKMSACPLHDGETKSNEKGISHE
jgi:cytochrome c oxidase cbb3-type subunit 3